MIELKFFVPETHVEQVKSALFAAGAGKIGNYDSCCWQVLGDGQYRPRSGANPYLGVHDELVKIKEYRVEMVLEDALLDAVIQALKQAHPYEEPAYSAVQVLSV